MYCYFLLASGAFCRARFTTIQEMFLETEAKTKKEVDKLNARVAESRSRATPSKYVLSIESVYKGDLCDSVAAPAVSSTPGVSSTSVRFPILQALSPTRRFTCMHAAYITYL